MSTNKKARPRMTFRERRAQRRAVAEMVEIVRGLRPDIQEGMRKIRGTSVTRNGLVQLLGSGVLKEIRIVGPRNEGIYCPLTCAARGRTGTRRWTDEWFLAARSLGISERYAQPIVWAADGKIGTRLHLKPVREALLEVCGLTEKYR